MKENDTLQNTVTRLHDLLRMCLIELEKVYPYSMGTPPKLIQEIEKEGINI